MLSASTIDVNGTAVPDVNRGMGSRGMGSRNMGSAGRACRLGMASALVAVGVLGGAVSATAAPRTTPAISVDTSATPPGWLPVAYGDAQLSVPADWRLERSEGCPGAGGAAGLVSLGTPPPGTFSCPAELAAASSLLIEPLVSPGLSSSGQKPVVVNGIEVYAQFGAPGSGGYQVPSLGVQVEASGPLSARILATLTRSPRAVAFAPGRAPAVPATWHRLSFGGVSLSVPAAWPVETATSWSDGCSPLRLSLGTTSVELNWGRRMLALPCPMLVGPGPITAPVDGVVVDPGRYGPLDSSGGTGPCTRVGGLTACPTTTDLYGVLVLSVTVPGSARPVAVEIGLAGTGVTARTILRSLRPAG